MRLSIGFLGNHREGPGWGRMVSLLDTRDFGLRSALYI